MKPGQVKIRALTNVAGLRRGQEKVMSREKALDLLDTGFVVLVSERPLGEQADATPVVPEPDLTPEDVSVVVETVDGETIEFEGAVEERPDDADEGEEYEDGEDDGEPSEIAWGDGD